MAANSGEARASLRPFATFLVAFVVVTFVLTAVAFSLLGPKPEPPLRVVDVTVTPAVPVPDQGLTVVAVMEGGSEHQPPSVWLFHASSYRNEIAGTEPMRLGGRGVYSASIGPFANGAEVWIVVAAASPTQGPVFSQHVLLPVGTVDKSPGQITVVATTLVPTAPGPSTPVTVSAPVQTATFVTKVFLTWGWFARTTVGAGNRFMGTQDGVTYVAPIDDTGFGQAYPPGTQFFYRVAAIDANRVCADSGILSFTIA